MCDSCSTNENASLSCGTIILIAIAAYLLLTHVQSGSTQNDCGCNCGCGRSGVAFPDIFSLIKNNSCSILLLFMIICCITNIFPFRSIGSLFSNDCCGCNTSCNCGCNS